MPRSLRWTALIIGLVGTIAVLNLSFAQSAADEYTEYEGQTLGRAETRRQLAGRPITVKDYFSRVMTQVPRDVERMASPRQFVTFRAQEGYGSGLVCLVNRNNEDAVEVLQKSVEGDKVLMSGRIRRAGTVFVFLVEELYRGWERPASRAITFTISDPDGRVSRSYRLNEPGKTYQIRSPYDNRVLHISFSR